MNWYIKGILTEKILPFIVVENNGIGYKIRVSFTTFSSLPDIGNEVKIFTYLSLKNEEFEIFGFSTSRERDIFLKLIDIPKIGPKTAISIFNTLSVEDFENAVNNSDPKVLARAKNVSKKLAESIILELAGKIAFENRGVAKDAYDALKSLGFSDKDISPILNDVLKNVKNPEDVEEIIKEVLKRLR
uniref:Holliday junction branch migration complex subunit RuvA n=1 Tax=candidate division WOR-3 bacterium TaxID=2052148 RepID=A0A7C3NFU4_UNCW3